MASGTCCYPQKWCLPKVRKQLNLCEVCFKPFNLANIEIHLEAGCAAEIYARYNMKPMTKSSKPSVSVISSKLVRKTKKSPQKCHTINLRKK